MTRQPEAPRESSTPPQVAASASPDVRRVQAGAGEAIKSTVEAPFLAEVPSFLDLQVGQGYNGKDRCGYWPARAGEYTRRYGARNDRGPVQIWDGRGFQKCKVWIDGTLQNGGKPVSPMEVPILNKDRKYDCRKEGTPRKVVDLEFTDPKTGTPQRIRLLVETYLSDADEHFTNK